MTQRPALSAKNLKAGGFVDSKELQELRLDCVVSQDLPLLLELPQVYTTRSTSRLD